MRRVRDLMPPIVKATDRVAVVIVGGHYWITRNGRKILGPFGSKDEAQAALETLGKGEAE